MEINQKSVEELVAHKSTMYVSVATSSKEGKLDIAAVGTAYLPCDGTITMLRGPLNRTYQNLLENPEAVIMAVNTRIGKWIKYFLKGNYQEPMGYRLHVKFVEEREITEDIRHNSIRRFGSLLKTKGGKRINNSLKKQLVFKIIEIRAINF